MGVVGSVKFPCGVARAGFGLMVLALSPALLALDFEPVERSLLPAGWLADKSLHAIAAADFDSDGIQDLALSFSDDFGAGVTLFRGMGTTGHKRANSPAFGEPLTTVLTPWLATELLAGDFDADGSFDLLAARSGATSLQPLLGDGRGELRVGPPVALAGGLTAIAAGEVNRRDGLADLVVATSAEGLALVTVFQGSAGALEATPMVAELPAPARSIALGELDGRLGVDVALAAADQLVLLRGYDAGRAALTGAEPEVFAWGEEVLDLTVKDFLPVHEGRELAVLDAGGRLAIVSAQGGFEKGKEIEAPGLGILDEMPVAADKTSRLQAASLGTGGFGVLVFNRAGEVEMVSASDALGAVELFAAKSLSFDERPERLFPMRLDGDATDEFVMLSSGKTPLSMLRQKGGAAIVVDSALDNDTAGDAACTLREAINNANADADTTGGDCTAGAANEVITFAIGGGGATQTIALASELPEITSPVVLDATGQCASPPCVELDGSALVGNDVDAFTALGGSSTIRGFVMNGFPRSGVSLTGEGGNLVAGNYIGTSLDGSTAVGMGGTAIFIRSSDNTIGGRTAADRNVLSGLGQSGVAIFAGTGNRVEGNYVGVNAAGTQALPNTDAGVFIGNVSGTTVGGVEPNAGNLLSANRWGVGIRRFSDTADLTEDNLVQGNLIGTDVTGAVAIGNDAEGIFIWDASNNTIGGSTAGARNIISGNGFIGDFAPYAGIFIVPFQGRVTTGNVIQGNYLGTNAAGDAALPNANAGVLVQAASETRIGGSVPGEGNLISGNLQAGISALAFQGATGGGDIIQGNRIGTNAAGTAAIPNGGQGIFLQDHVGNLIGGTAAGAGNLISGNGNFGIQVNQNSNDNTIQGNLVGTTSDGLGALPNVGTGVFITRATGSIVGGTETGARNVVSGNGVHGIQLFDNASNSVVQGNYVGIDAAGTGALGNGEVGVFIGDQSADNTIGGTDPGAANVISDNGSWGVFAGTAGAGNTILGNLIGTDALGNGTFGNDVHGVFLFDSTSQTIGGSLPGAGNTIVGSASNGIAIGGTNGPSNDNVVQGNTIRDNVVHGVAVNQGTGNLISQNSLVNNGGQAIELNGDGPSANDPQDADTGANNLQNFPELDRAQPGSTIISGTLNSTPDTTFTVEFFSSMDCQMREAGEFLESIQVTTDGNGDADVSATLTATVPEGQGITATATDPDGNTSELSVCVRVAGEEIFANGFEETL